MRVNPDRLVTQICYESWCVDLLPVEKETGNARIDQRPHGCTSENDRHTDGLGAGGKRCLNASRRILEDQLLFWINVHHSGGLQENIRRGLHVLHMFTKNDVTAKLLEELAETGTLEQSNRLFFRCERSDRDFESQVDRYAKDPLSLRSAMWRAGVRSGTCPVRGLSPRRSAPPPSLEAGRGFLRRSSRRGRR